MSDEYGKFVVMDDAWAKTLNELTESQRDKVISMLADNIAITQRDLYIKTLNEALKERKDE